MHLYEMYEKSAILIFLHITYAYRLIYFNFESIFSLQNTNINIDKTCCKNITLAYATMG